MLFHFILTTTLWGRFWVKYALLLTWEGEITCSGLRPRLDGPNRVLFNPLLGYLSCFFVSLLNRQVDPPVTYTFLGSLHLINGIIIIKWKVLSHVQLFVTPWTNTIHGILKARILEWIAFPFSRGSSWSRNQTGVSCIARKFFTCWATREALLINARKLFSLSYVWTAWLFYPLISPTDVHLRGSLQATCCWGSWTRSTHI